jgi:hypothetical protein
MKEYQRVELHLHSRLTAVVGADKNPPVSAAYEAEK